MSTLEKLQTRCAIIGGGPAGMMAGYLLARAGVPVAVLEKHGDFNRDFRGDTIHPSTLELMQELGLLEEFLKLPHQELREIRGNFNGHAVEISSYLTQFLMRQLEKLLQQPELLHELEGGRMNGVAAKIA